MFISLLLLLLDSHERETFSTYPIRNLIITVDYSHLLAGENQQTFDRASPVNGPGLAKPLAMTTSAKEQQQQQRIPSSNNPAGKKRVDAALEKNIETIVTQVRRTTTKPSQLTQNDLQMFDSTAPTTTILRNSHHSRETTPITSSTASKQSSSSSREMTPDSINTDSANEDQQQQQQTIRNGHHYQRSLHASSSSSSTVDLTSTHLPTYAPQVWPPAAAYPFAHQHPGLYLPYPLTTTSSSTPTNGMPPLYPAYDPAFIEQHYGPQALAAYYSQQQARLLQEHAAMSGTPSSPTSFRESQSLTDLLNHPATNSRPPHRIHPHLNEQQQMMFSHLYLNQIASLPYVTLYENAAAARSFRSNGEMGENEILIVLHVVHSCRHHQPHVFSTCPRIVKTSLRAV